MQIRRKISSFLFAGILLAPFFFIINFHVRQYQIRHEMKEAIEQEMLHSFSIETSSINWIRQGKELSINGKMFDVEKIIYKEDGTAILTGLFDDEETALVQQLEKACQQQNNPNSNSSLVKLLSFQLAMPLKQEINSNTLSLSLNNWPRPVKQACPASCRQDMLTPPPEFL